ncbi:CAMK family protein kinase [Trichomonas vaginalis G3]|uniref:non-specific serine/threonine protein kinase n=1 Tax=Trichomonas vaginalis (strain ATCC PRA-98 / G3) TaxID=412133 RepID=A2EJ14_TRIV3|nr:protein serine/threonine kinase protein [Trichomonas vaginalis G3]EAY07317.1 CAMK family protein kinase [Trichomonas vaginalis G3]KAI5524488.1 protein serine/threonine kinase protein [Trichomonas vaginalis G3]|eukprot:XP_001319540.1 CAMK family protein kinase [Trichomonas vaginalis G3]
MESCVTDNYDPKFKIGDGGFSQVFFALHRKTCARVAIKMISKRDHNEDGKQLDRINREISILKSVKHPFISELFDVIETSENTYLIMEYIQNGTLLNSINENGPYNEEEAATIFAQLNLVLQYLQTNCKVAHRDIKAENIMFDAHHNIRLIDFGLSIQEKSIMNTQCGSPSYASPEMILGKPYGYASDIWSCGVLLFIMVVGHLPFEDVNITRLAQKILYQEVEYPTNLSDDLIDLLKKMLTKDPEERITLEGVINHKWVHDKVLYVQDKIKNFQYDDKYIFDKMLNIKSTDVYEYIGHGLVNQSTISYCIARREYMSNTIETMSKEEKKRLMHKQNAYKDIVALPRLLVPEKAKSGAKRKSLPNGTPNINVNTVFIRRKMPSVLVRNI